MDSLTEQSKFRIQQSHTEWIRSILQKWSGKRFKDLEIKDYVTYQSSNRLYYQSQIR